MLKPQFVDELRARMRREGSDVETIDQLQHKRRQVDDPEESTKAAARIYQEIGELAQAARIEKFIGTLVYSRHEYGKLVVRYILTLISQCREAANDPEAIRQLVDQRMQAMDLLDRYRGGDIDMDTPVEGDLATVDRYVK